MRNTDFIIRRPIAHRGLHDLNRNVWENTLSSSERAIEAGYAIECDVILSSDGVAIVHHDLDLKRLTGQSGFVWQRTADEFSALRVGGTDDHPPRLSELLDLVSGRVPLIVEIKGAPGHDAGLVASVANDLTAYDGEVAVMSFDHWIIRDFGCIPQHIPRGLTAMGMKQQEMEAHFSMLAHDIDFVSYHVQQLSNPFLRFCREKLSMPIISWTVRDQETAAISAKSADQITFEGFVPEPV
ncbi:glycerophosphodiester phosphodiesterase [Limoniibacter endophyticus]|uniref:Glycerophosphoryl diester phosphodiesterase n=1 Tax=Limoniibacter endophyticus TaxID=1565040 RepID=A0A8J3DLN4_9HYPH|nr:glycerophosphodiester phosphodiesterase [Limoniibacter endophyticus]GHC62142.1 glycerophosphoryl diester phosphodiesterase [Limoniibacter endophyticus]